MSPAQWWIHRELELYSPSLQDLILNFVSVSYSFSHVQLFATPWTAACQAPLSMEFSRQEYWSGWPFPSPGNLLNPGVELESLLSPALAGRFNHLGSPLFLRVTLNVCVRLNLPCSHCLRRKWQPTPVLLPRKSHGQRSLVSMGSQNVRLVWTHYI